MTKTIPHHFVIFCQLIVAGVFTFFMSLALLLPSLAEANSQESTLDAEITSLLLEIEALKAELGIGTPVCNDCSPVLLIEARSDDVSLKTIKAAPVEDTNGSPTWYRFFNFYVETEMQGVRVKEMTVPVTVVGSKLDRMVTGGQVYIDNTARGEIEINDDEIVINFNDRDFVLGSYDWSHVEIYLTLGDFNVRDAGAAITFEIEPTSFQFHESDSVTVRGSAQSPTHVIEVADIDLSAAVDVELFHYDFDDGNDDELSVSFLMYVTARDEDVYFRKTVSDSFEDQTAAFYYYVYGTTPRLEGTANIMTVHSSADTSDGRYVVRAGETEQFVVHANYPIAWMNNDYTAQLEALTYTTESGEQVRQNVRLLDRVNDTFTYSNSYLYSDWVNAPEQDVLLSDVTTDVEKVSFATGDIGTYTLSFTVDAQYKDLYVGDHSYGYSHLVYLVDGDGNRLPRDTFGNFSISLLDWWLHTPAEEGSMYVVPKGTTETFTYEISFNPYFDGEYGFVFNEGFTIHDESNNTYRSWRYTRDLVTDTIELRTNSQATASVSAESQAVSLLLPMPLASATQGYHAAATKSEEIPYSALAAATIVSPVEGAVLGVSDFSGAQVVTEEATGSFLSSLFSFDEHTLAFAASETNIAPYESTTAQQYREVSATKSAARTEQAQSIPEFEISQRISDVADTAVATFAAQLTIKESSNQSAQVAGVSTDQLTQSNNFLEGIFTPEHGEVRGVADDRSPTLSSFLTEFVSGSAGAVLGETTSNLNTETNDLQKLLVFPMVQIVAIKSQLSE